MFVAEQYKILWDYGEELNRTNLSVVQIEGKGLTLKRLCICLGACKEGFKVGCRLVIGLNGCFIKSTQHGQIWATVEIDEENCMFPMAIIDAENKANQQ